MFSVITRSHISYSGGLLIKLWWVAHFKVLIDGHRQCVAATGSMPHAVRLSYKKTVSCLFCWSTYLFPPESRMSDQLRLRRVYHPVVESCQLLEPLNLRTIDGNTTSIDIRRSNSRAQQIFNRLKSELEREKRRFELCIHRWDQLTCSLLSWSVCHPFVT